MCGIKKAGKIIKFITNHPLAGKNKTYAIARFLTWQLSQVIFPARRIVQFIGEVKLSVTRGMAGATGNIYTGLHEFKDMGFLLHFLRKEDLFADIGANVGSYTMLASGYIRCKSVCFEPVPETFSNLMENVRINKLESLVQAENMGAGSKNETLYFTAHGDSVNHVVSDPEKSEDDIPVKVVPVDDIFKSHHPILMKIDVEGFESEVLKGMTNILNGTSLKAIIIELNGSGARYGFDEREIHQKLLSNGFLPFSYDPFQRELTEIDCFGSHNTIYIRDMKIVRQRIMSAPKVKVLNIQF